MECISWLIDTHLERSGLRENKVSSKEIPCPDDKDSAVELWSLSVDAAYRAGISNLQRTCFTVHLRGRSAEGRNQQRSGVQESTF